MLLRKASAGSAGIGPGYTWTRDGQILEVPDHHGAELLAIKDAGFTAVEPGVEEDVEALLEQAPDDLAEAEAESAPEPAPVPVKAARPRKATAAKATRG